MTVAQRTAGSLDHQRRHRKVTYSLPVHLVDELDRRTAGAPRTKSAVVTEALTFFFSAKDRMALAEIYAEAAQDPLFQADNRTILRDFAALDPDWEDLGGEEQR